MSWSDFFAKPRRRERLRLPEAPSETLSASPSSAGSSSTASSSEGDLPQVDLGLFLPSLRGYSPDSLVGKRVADMEVRDFEYLMARSVAPFYIQTMQAIKENTSATVSVGTKVEGVRDQIPELREKAISVQQTKEIRKEAHRRVKALDIFPDPKSVIEGMGIPKALEDDACTLVKSAAAKERSYIKQKLEKLLAGSDDLDGLVEEYCRPQGLHVAHAKPILVGAFLGIMGGSPNMWELTKTMSSNSDLDNGITHFNDARKTWKPSERVLKALASSAQATNKEDSSEDSEDATSSGEQGSSKKRPRRAEHVQEGGRKRQKGEPHLPGEHQEPEESESEQEEPLARNRRQGNP